MDNRLIDIQGLGVAFGRRPALQNVSIQVKSGEMIALVGANGSGKSTLLRSFMRLELPDRGSGTVLGNSIHDDVAHYNAQIGYVSEMLEFHLPVPLKKIATFYKTMRPGFSTSEFERICQLFQLDTSKQASDYSRGQRMQFAFALAIAAAPRLILLDEVTAVLDIHVRDLVIREVQRLVSAGAAAVIATNILTEVIPYADRLVIMDHGRIALDTGLTDLNERFTKLRVSGIEDYTDDNLRILKGSSDGSMTCLIPSWLYNEELQLRLKGRAVPSGDPVTAEDVFLYHCRKGA